MENSKIRIPLFDGLAAEVVYSFMEDRFNAHRAYEDGEYVARQGALCRSLYILTEGTLLATMTSPEGKRLTIERLTAPEILAPAFIFGDENRFPVDLMAQGSCRVCMISKANFLNFMHEHPSVMERFIAEISNRCVFLSKKLNEFALQDLRHRVVGYLRKYGKIENQQKAASVLGVARPSLARVLSELHKEKIIRWDGNDIVLS